MIWKERIFKKRRNKTQKTSYTKKFNYKITIENDI